MPKAKTTPSPTTPPIRGHNSAGASPLDVCADRIRALHERVRKTGAAALRTNVEIGVELLAAEPHFATKADLVIWAERKTGLKRRQVYNLLKLGRKRGDLRRALEWAETPEAAAHAAWFYIDGVDDLLRAHMMASGLASPTAPLKPKPKAKAESPTIRLRRAALVLSAEVEQLRAMLNDHGVEPPSLGLETADAMEVARAEAAKLAVDLAKTDAQPAAPVEPSAVPVRVPRATTHPVNIAKRRGRPPGQPGAPLDRLRRTPIMPERAEALL
jgi:hypothetical protein